MALHIYDGLNWIRQAIESNSHTLRQLYYQLAALKNHTVIIVWEGKGGNDRRRKFYTEYKRNRVRPQEDIFRSIELFQQLINHAGVYQIGLPGYEGDDVIAALVKEFSGKTEIFVHSTDKDFRQLTTLGARVDSNPIPECDDRYIRLYKTLVGDPSDNIKGLKGFGKVAWARLDHKYLLPFFEREQFASFLPELAFMEQKHFINLTRDVPMISTYWKITGFFDIPMQEMGPHLKTAPLNHAAAEEIMQRYIIH